MLITRSREPQNTAVEVIEIDDTDSDDGLETDNDFFSSDDDHEEPRTVTRPKRPRTSTTSTSRTAAASRGKKFNFLKLSSELQDHIFTFTHPKALLRLAWTCKKIKHALFSRRAEHIWKKARLADHSAMQIPACPDDVSELRWAHLLFGPTICFSCSAPNIHTIIFPFRRRACVVCMKKKMMWEKKFPKLYPAYDASLLWLIPHSNVGPWAHGHESTGKFYWQPDLDNMLAKLAEYTAAVAADLPGAQRALREWKAAQIVQASEICEDAKGYVDWVNAPVQEQSQDLRIERKKIVEAKLVDAGWDVNVVRELRYWPSSNPTKAEITAGVWTTMKKRLEPKLQQIKERRIEMEKLEAVRRAAHERVEEALRAARATRAVEEAARRAARAQVVEAERIAKEQANRLKTLIATVSRASAMHAKSLGHQLWYTIPSFAVIYRMPPIIPIVDQVLAGKSPWAEAETVLMQLPALCAQWLEERKATLIEKRGLRLPGFSVVEPPHLELAICVFVCSGAYVLCSGLQLPVAAFGILPKDKLVPIVGLAELLKHERLHQNLDFKFKSSGGADSALIQVPLVDVSKFSPRGCLAAMMLVTELGLDARTTRPMDVDRIDARFKCANCINNDPHYLGHIYMDWRRAISHFIEADDSYHRDPLWIRLPSDQLQSLREERDRTDLAHAHKAKQWACARCNKHYLALEDHLAVSLHLEQSHKISAHAAKEGVDYFWAGDIPRPLPSFFSRVSVAAALPQVVPKPSDKNPNAVFACFLCSPARKRRFVIIGIQDHIQTVHKIPKSDIQEIVHYGRME